MDAAYATRTMPPLPQPTRPDLTPPQQSVTTDLPQEKSVAVMADSQGVRPGGSNDKGRRAAENGAVPLSPEMRRQATRDTKVEIDEATSDFVYQTVDDFGEVLAQFPNETMMKIRAYVREDSAPAPETAIPAETAAPATPHVERLV
jgi:hypothetical protein